MAATKLIWFFVWRLGSLGAASGALLVGSYRALALAIPMAVSVLADGWQGGIGLGWVIGTFLLFAAEGAVVGFLLGVTGGLLVALLTKSGPPRFAGGVCAGWTVLALLADWLLHDFPNTYGFVLERGLVGEVAFEESSAASVVILALVPTMLLASGMWWTGRRVAIRYAQRNPSAPQ